MSRCRDHFASMVYFRLWASLGRLALALVFSAGCAADEERQTIVPPVAGAPAPEDAGIVTATPLCAADNPFCQQPALAPTGTGAPMLVPTQTDCGAVPIDLRPAGVNIMIAVDGAASMMAHWADLSTAIRSL